MSVIKIIVALYLVFGAGLELWVAADVIKEYRERGYLWCTLLGVIAMIPFAPIVFVVTGIRRIFFN